MRRALGFIGVLLATVAVSFGSYEVGMALRGPTVEYVTPSGAPTTS